jgi:signal transduction histidine kinase
LREQVALTSNNPIINNILCSVHGLLAILNEHRQIVTVNSLLLKSLGIKEAETALGLRLGEALNCTHSREMPGGCGTSKHCRSCGAVLSIVSSLAEGRPVEDRCVITIDQGEQESAEHAFFVRACPLEVEGRRFVVLFLREVTDEERRVSIERAFFHDINNIVSGLSLASEIIRYEEGPDKDDIADSIARLVEQLRSEIEVHRTIATHRAGDYQPTIRSIRLPRLLDDIANLVRNHPMSGGKEFVLRDLAGPAGLTTFHSDINLVRRIVINMLINAMEASGDHDEVRLTVEREADEVVFRVWNKRPIPSDITLRIFQYQFTTKSGAGRGMGTYSMKLFGESILGGKVSFRTSEDGGTEFSIRLPIRAELA